MLFRSKDLNAVHSKEAEIVKDPPVTLMTKAEKVKDLNAVPLNEAEIVKDRPVKPMKDHRIVKAAMTANLQKRIMPEVSQVHQVLTEAYA